MHEKVKENFTDYGVIYDITYTATILQEPERIDFIKQRDQLRFEINQLLLQVEQLELLHL